MSGPRPAVLFACAVVGVALLTTFALPGDHAALDELYVGTLASGVAAVVVGAVRRPQRTRSPWVVTAVGLALYALGDVLWIADTRQGLDPFPSPADLFLLGGTGLLVVAGFWMARVDSGRLDRWASLDAAVVSLGAGGAVWVFSVVPYTAGTSLLTVEGLVVATYPAMDVVLVATVARLLLGSSRSGPDTRVLLVAVALLTLADIVHYRQELLGTDVEWGGVDALYMLAVGCFGVAALAPSRREEPPGVRTVLPGRIRLGVLMVTAAAPLLVLAAAADLPPAHRVALTLVAVATVVLIVARTWVLMQAIEQAAADRGRQQLDAMVRGTKDALLVIDEDGRILYASPSVDEHWGLSSCRLVGEELATLVPPRVQEAAGAWARTVHPGTVADSVVVDGDGRRRSVRVSVSDVDHHGRGARLVTAHDISDRVALERTLRVRASTDGLTGLANREAFHVALLAATHRRSPSSVLFLDLDDFKEVNDALGHDAGDRVLVEVARRLSSLVRPTDTVARLGGDEFAVLLEGVTSPAEVAATTDRIGTAVRAPIDRGGMTLRVSVSIGIAEVGPGQDPKEVLRHADLAMYRAKRAGKDTTATYHDDLGDQAMALLRLRSRLGAALRSDEFELAYQPIVETHGDQVIGYEALLRWSMDGRTVPPEDFVPVAESTGDIVSIGTWVLEEACRAVVAHTGTAEDGPYISVNVSAVQLADGFVEAIERVLAETGLPRGRLQLELTESVFADPDAAETFVALRPAGVRLAVDDFGTGWCSLAYLRRLPLDCIKVDRTFTADVATNPEFYRGVVSLARSVSALCLAEGVESAEQARALAGLGVTSAQGWFYGVPGRIGEMVPDPGPSLDGRAPTADEPVRGAPVSRRR